MVEQITELLAGGFTQQQVSETLGCSVALISEQLTKPEVLERIKVRAHELQQERIEKRYANLEEATLKQIATDIQMMDAASLCRVLETVNKNRIAARAPANHFGNPTAGHSITLVLPAAASDTKILVDSKNQVVAIDNRSMATLPISGVQQLFKSLGESYEADAIAS